MIYGYGSRAADWTVMAVWIMTEFGLFHYFAAKIPKRRQEGAKMWAVPILWWGMLTGLQIGQTTIPFFVNFFARLTLLTFYINITGQVSLFLSGYVTFVFYLVKDICKMLVINVACPLLGVSVMEDPRMNTGAMIVCAAMQLGILNVIRRRIWMDDKGDLGREDMGVLFFPAASYGLIKYLQMRDFAVLRQQDLTMAAVCMMLCVCDLVILLKTEHWIIAQRVKEEAEALRVRSQALQEQYSQEQEKIRQINGIYHDMRHHLNYIGSLSDNGKIQEYIRSITRDMESCQVFSSTGNQVIDSVLSRCIGQCAPLGIRLIPSVNGGIFGFMEPKDLLVIFGNALDNAREAAGKMERQEDKEIRVRAGARKNFAVIRVENHFPGHVALDRAGEVKTTKAGEGHGYGIKNMRAAARRYGGEVSVEAKDGMFILTVAIPVSGNGEKADDL